VNCIPDVVTYVVVILRPLLGCESKLKLPGIRARLGLKGCLLALKCALGFGDRPSSVSAHGALERVRLRDKRGYLCPHVVRGRKLKDLNLVLV
jgi:hypothetical protein